MESLEKKKSQKNVYVQETLEERIKNASQQTRAKRDYQKKKPTQEEKNKMEYEEMLHYNEVENIEEEIIEFESEWDVPVGQKIEYFDPSLSYELTGYRPITKDKGLDFDPKLFTIPADTYRKNKKYTNMIPNTFRWINHWNEEFRRCVKGYTVGKYTLTGQNYFFLNYYRLLSPISDEESATARAEDFPAFLAKQYEYFHYLELCKKSGHDGLAFKSRGVGASEIAASNCAHAFTFLENSMNIVTAFAENYVEDTLDKVWQELAFLDTKTEGAFKHLKQGTNSKWEKVASKIDKDGVEYGFMSTVKGIVADTPDKLRGKRTDNLYFEESGNNKYLIETYSRGEPLVIIGGRRVGNRFVFGTSGEQGPKLAGLKTMFYNPKGYLILPFFNTSTASGDPQLTGYFIPSYQMWFGSDDGTIKGYDERGVVNEEAAKQDYLNKWAQIEDPHALIIKKAEYCFTPEDAFVLEGDNMFDREKLAEQLSNIEIHKIVEKPKNYKLHWPIKNGESDYNSKPELKEDPLGKIQIVELPITDDSGIAMRNLYVAGGDGVDQDSTTSTGQTDVSEFCMVILRRQVGLQSPKVVAIYKDRPKKIQDAFANVLKLCQFYNCKLLMEATRISVKNYFEQKGFLSYMMHRPQATANSSGRTNFKQYGAPATQAIIEHQLDLIDNYIDNYCETIQFPNMIDELLRYSYANKRKFDIVAAMGLCLLADEELLTQRMKVQEQNPKKLKDVGYYRDQYGRVQYGIIQKEEISTDRYGWVRTKRY